MTYIPKSRPDKPGEWHSRDGRRIVVFEYDGVLKYRGFENKLGYNRLWLARELPEGEWLPAVAPEFPPLPPKPVLVYATRPLFDAPDWVTIAYGQNTYYRGDGGSGRLCGLTVVPHPDNDPEAVRLIEKAHEDGKRGRRSR